MNHSERKPTIALLCARPPEQNTGMATVDLAGWSFLSTAFPEASVELFYFGSPQRNPYPTGVLPFAYRDVWHERDAYLAADCRVVWGDFTQSACLWQPTADSWCDHNGPSAQEVASVTFLLGRDPEMLRRTISFGGTIITNTAATGDALYTRALRHFCQEAGRLLFRDAISAAHAAAYRHDQNTLGIDCAFLNSPDSLLSLPGFAASPSRSGVGVFFGRTPGLFRLISFASKVAAMRGSTMEWLPWFHSPRRQRMIVRAFGMNPTETQPSPAELLSRLSGYSLIITDTYHLAINAWRMGIPAICVGTGAGRAENSLSDKKKEVLYKMYGADPFYVFAEVLGTRDGRRASASAVCSALSDPVMAAKVLEQINFHRRRASADLITAVRGALTEAELIRGRAQPVISMADA